MEYTNHDLLYFKKFIYINTFVGNISIKLADSSPLCNIQCLYLYIILNSVTIDISYIVTAIIW